MFVSSWYTLYTYNNKTKHVTLRLEFQIIRYKRINFNTINYIRILYECRETLSVKIRQHTRVYRYCIHYAPAYPLGDVTAQVSRKRIGGEHSIAAAIDLLVHGDTLTRFIHDETGGRHCGGNDLEPNIKPGITLIIIITKTKCIKTVQYKSEKVNFVVFFEVLIIFKWKSIKYIFIKIWLVINLCIKHV